MTILLAVVFCIGGGSAFGQVTTGIPPFSSFSGGSFGMVNNANLNVHFAIPIVNKAGRGLPFSYSLLHDSSMWTPSSAFGSPVWTRDPLWGWHGTEAATGYSYVPTSTTGAFHFQYGQGQCSSGAYYTTFYNWVYTDPQGTQHPFNPSFSIQETNSDCPDVQSTWGATVATDGSGYSLCADATNSNHCTSTSQYIPAAAVTAPSGVVFSPYIWGSGTVKDTNGNTIDASATDNYTDTLGMTPLTVTGTNPISYTYPTTSGSASVKLSFSSYTVQTNFGCPGVSEFGATAENLVSSIVLADGTSYSFTYEPTPGYSGDVTGRIASITLPTGGTITYNYSNGANDGINCSDGSTDYLQRTTSGGTWTYTHSENGGDWTTTVTDPQGNETVYQFQGVYETERKIYQGSTSGALLETVDTCYNNSASPCTSTAITLPITQRSVTVTLPGASPSETVTDYNNYGLPTETDVYDYGGALLRKTVIDYAPLGNNIENRPSMIQVYDNSGHLDAQSNYTYDASGNLLTLSENVTSSSTIGRSFTYGAGGVLSSATDFDGHATGFTYGDCSSSFPTSVAQPLSLTSSLAWDCNTGLVTSVTDPNSQTTSFSYDDLYRLVQTNNPDGGQVSTAYNDTSSPVSVVTTTKLTASQNRVDTTLLDGLGRVSQTELNSDPAGADLVNTTYDSLGRVASVTNPYRGSPSGSTSYVYDALGRVTSVTYADGSIATTSYNGNCVTSTDPAGKKRETCANALGEVTKVIEDPGGLNYETDYSYDALGNLTTVNDDGQTRSYTYDMLSRLISATTPESGTTSYSYTASGGLCSGDPLNVCTRTDARGVAVTYTYDALNRLTSKSYSDGTPAANFWYDNSYAAFGNWSVSGLTNTKGRLYATCTSSAVLTCDAGYTGTVYSYDPMGRITTYWQATPYNDGSSAWQMAYNYDLAGDITSWTHPAGFTITNSINAAQQITQIQSSLVDAAHPQYLAKNITYSPWGAEQTLENGCASSSGQEQGCTDTVETYAYNNRLQPVMIELGNTSNASADYCLVYNYYANVGNPTSCAIPAQSTDDNGSVMGVFDQDNANTSLSHTEAYSYDALNRLSTAVATGNATYNLTFAYDRWGNMGCTINGRTGGPCPQYSFSSSTNRITNSGFTYDAAGNLTSDGTHTYQWDGEGRFAGEDNGATMALTYNALGLQAEYAVPWGTSYSIFDLDGAGVGGYSGGWQYMGAAKLGQRSVAVYLGNTWLMHENALGSSTVDTLANGSQLTDDLFYPWGQNWLQTTGDEYHWAAFGSDNPAGAGTMFRQYSLNQGRWLSPDPLGGDITNPQSLNRYAYVLNNPTTLTDPSGLGNCNPNFMSGCDGGNGPYCDPNDITQQWPCNTPLPPSPPPPPIILGGGSDGNGSNHSSPSAPPIGGGTAGLPPGVGDAFLGFHLFCSQARITQPVIFTDPAACELYFLGLRLGTAQFVGSLAAIAGISGSAFIPLIDAGPAAIGVNVTFAGIPGSKTGCFGIGPGAAFPATKGVSFGPLLFGNVSNTQSILSGWSLSSVAQPVPGRGVQVIGNASGKLIGPTVGTVGSSISFTVSGCHAF